MKRNLEFHDGFNNTIYIATIVIDKNGMRLENKTPSYERDDFFIRTLLTNCINMDNWQHSWHINVSDAKCRYSKKGREARKRVRNIMLDKIKSREEDIKKLKDGLNVLRRWHY
jgi:hypothetical protein